MHRLGRAIRNDAPVLMRILITYHQINLVQQSLSFSRSSIQQLRIMPSKRRKPETSAASLFQDKAKKKAKTTQSTLPPRIREWAALLPAEPEDQEPTSRAKRCESLSSGLTSVPASPSTPLNPSLHELSASKNDHFPLACYRKKGYSVGG